MQMVLQNGRSELSLLPGLRSQRRRQMVSKKLSLVLGILCAAFLILWFSDILPKQVAKSVAEKYMKNEVLYGEQYHAEYAEYSPAHDSYFVYFSGGPNPSGEMGTTRHVGVYYRYFPFFVWYDSMFPG